MSRRNRPDRRLRDLKQRVKQRVPPDPQVNLKDDLGKVLDDLNAWGFLDDQQQAQHRSILCFGPGVFRGYLPMAWVGVVLWHKPRGYYFYDTLGLLGIWALRAEPDGIEVVLGTRELTYVLPFFNAESYYYRIKREFRTFYNDIGSPPARDACRLATCYEPARRLDIRRQIEDELIAWAAEQHMARN